MKFSLFANEAVIGVDYVYTRFAYYIIICKVVCFQAENKFYISLGKYNDCPQSSTGSNVIRFAIDVIILVTVFKSIPKIQSFSTFQLGKRRRKIIMSVLLKTETYYLYC